MAGMIRSTYQRPALEVLIREAVERVGCMTPVERAEMYRAQRASFVRGEMGIGSDADEVEYAAALRVGDRTAIVECERKSRERVVAADVVLRERGLI